jgi:hypothetical protein
MASFANAPVLTINVNEGTDRATLRATGRINFDTLDRNLMEAGLSITVKASLMGDDDGELGRGDDDIVVRNINSQTFTGTQPAQVDYVLQKDNVSTSALNEDTGVVSGMDELYAHAAIVNSLNPNSTVATRKSNVIKGAFPG